MSGQPEGTTLLECINTGAVPFPERMPYVRWLEWRKETGSRPVKRRDGRSTSTAEEVALWRSVMDFLHDMKEEDEEEGEEEEDDEDESPPPEEPVDDLDGPELIPDAGDGLSEAAALEQAAASAAAAAPSAGATGLAAAGDSALAVVPLSADRRAGLSGPPSTAGSVPATAESLQADLREMFRPDQEPVADYLTRISRIVLALRAHGVAISSAELDGLATKATLLAEEFGQVGGDWHPTRMVRRLRARFAAAALKEGDDGDDVDVQKEIQAIGELIIALGGKQSASADKVWSSPSDIPPGAAGASPPVPPTAFSRLWRAVLRRRPVRRLSPCWARPALAPRLGRRRRPILAPWPRSWPLRSLRMQTGWVEATLLCAPGWRRWRWSLRLSSAAPTGARLSPMAGRRLTLPLPSRSRQRP